MMVSPSLQTATIGSKGTETSTIGSQSTEIATIKQQLLTTLAPLNRGFNCKSSDRLKVKRLVRELNELNPTAEPTAAFRPGGSLDGKWRLIYSDAPDIITLDSGPLADVGFIGQEISTERQTITNIIQYSAPTTLGLPDDLTEQKVVLSGKISSSERISLNLCGLLVTPTKVFGQEVPGWLRFGGVFGDDLSLLRPYFGHFDIWYLDDEIRIIRTNSGYIAINQKC